ncbi:MAG: hypothetical protein DRG78_00520 [Epsilonproteobacteria bacterium]|nr:MAG: hypothetical protein DRG78_00520 [Campylobacterota bacterium]
MKFAIKLILIVSLLVIAYFGAQAEQKSQEIDDLLKISITKCYNIPDLDDLINTALAVKLYAESEEYIKQYYKTRNLIFRNGCRPIVYIKK